MRDGSRYCWTTFGGIIASVFRVNANFRVAAQVAAPGSPGPVVGLTVRARRPSLDGPEANDVDGSHTPGKNVEAAVRADLQIDGSREAGGEVRDPP
jgi:hypothetical protein